MRWILGWVVLLVVLGSAQELVWERTGVDGESSLRMWFYRRVPVLRDINGDGYDDVVIMASTLQRYRWEGGLQLWFLSGKDGSLLRVRPGFHDTGFQNGVFRQVMAAGDMNGDGIGDYVATAYRMPYNFYLQIQACDGATDRILWSHEFVVSPRHHSNQLGVGMLAGVDLDGDGRGDVLIDDVNAGGAGELYAFSSDGRLLYTVRGTPGSLQIAAEQAALGDVDGDGCEDFLTTDGGWSFRDRRGRVALVSGRTGKILRVYAGERPKDHIGYSITACGDMDGDGVPDFATGTYGALAGTHGSVLVYSTRTGKVLWRFEQPDPSVRNPTFGRALVGGFDADLDGVPDLLTGDIEEVVQRAPLQAGAIYVFSGRDGSILWRDWKRPVGFPSYSALGANFGVLGVQPGNPFPAVIVFNNWWGYNRAYQLQFRGRIRCVRMNPPGAEVYGMAGQGTLRAPPRIGMRTLWDQRWQPRGVRIHLSGVPPGARAVLMLGYDRAKFQGHTLPQVLAFWLPLKLPGCMLYLDPVALVPVRAGTQGKQRGYAYVDLPTPPRLAGKVTLHAQWLVFDGKGGGGVSAAIRWRS